jgi:RNA 3'-terminal phosphate cyclase (ATP)
LQADKESTVVLEGGTHNPMAPPVDFLESSFAPVLARMGISVSIGLERYGFYPAGGGQIRVQVKPGRLQPISMLERGAPGPRLARAIVSALPGSVAERELAVVSRRMGFEPEELAQHSVRPAVGPGNVLMLSLSYANVTAAFAGFGERGISAESVAERVCQRAREYLDSGAAVEAHLADQLLLPLALAGGGEFTTTEPTEHLRTNAALIEKFAPVEIEVTQEAGSTSRWRVCVSS